MPGKIHLIVAVWGPEYIGYFLSLCLRSLMASHNLPIVSGNLTLSCVFKIYTYKSDEIVIRNSSVFQSLEAIMPVEFIHIELENRKFSLMNRCHNDAIAEARKQAAYLFFLAPDHIYSNGAFETALQLITQGAKAIMVFPVHANRDQFIAQLLDNYVTSDSRCIDISARDLVKEWRTQLHSMSSFIMVESHHYPNDGNPCVFGWKISPHTYLFRSTQFLPFAVLPEKECMIDKFSLDTIFIHECFSGNLDGIVFLNDSDQGVQVTIRPCTERNGPEFDYPNVPTIALHFQSFRQSGNGRVEYLNNPVLFHDSQSEKNQNNNSIIHLSNEFCKSIMALSSFNLLQDFEIKLRNYYTHIIDGRKLQILGKGHILALTKNLFKRMDIAFEVVSTCDQVEDGCFVIIAVTHENMENLFSQLNCRGFRNNVSFQVSPMCYRSFRRRMTRKDFYYYWTNYVLYSYNIGIRTSLVRVYGKILNKLRGINI